MAAPVSSDGFHRYNLHPHEPLSFDLEDLMNKARSCANKWADQTCSAESYLGVISRTVDNPEFRKNPKEYVKQMVADRGTAEYSFPLMDYPLEFFKGYFLKGK